MTKRLLAMIVLLLPLWLAPALCRGEAALTLMVYLCGSNLETEAGAASADLAEMAAHYPDDGSLRVIVLPSGAKAWQNEAAGDAAIYELTGEGLSPLCALPERSMGDPEALTALLDWGYAHAPAEQYALLMWNHGAGPRVGLCFDERFESEGGMDGLTLAELSSALERSPAAREKLAWIGFDACLMATVETACAVAPYAQYMIASQETEPASGWSYAFLKDIAADESGAQTGRRAIDAYFASLADSLSSLTLSCVELGRMPDISRAMDRLFDGLHLRLDEGSYSAFADCRVDSKSLGSASSYEYDLIDLVDLLEVYQAAGMAECSELLSLLDQAIVESRSNTPYIHGLSVYYPHYGAEESPDIAPSEGYAAFIADMSALRLGKPLTDWSQTARPEAALRDGVTRITMALTQEQAAMLDSAALMIFKQMSEDDYQLVYRTHDVTLSQDHVLSADYGEEALFIVDAQGRAASEALPYFLQGDAVVLSGRLTRGTDVLEDENWYAFVNCYFRRDESGCYRLAEVREITDDPSLQGKATIRLEDYDTLSIYQGSMIPAYGSDGSLLPPDRWNQGDMVYGWWFDLADVPDWSIAFLSQQDGRSRYALLQMTDTQNQVICTELLPIPNPNIIDIPAQAQTLVDNDHCRIRFTGAQEVRGMEPALRLHFTCDNRGSEPVAVNARMIQLDDAIMNSRVAASGVAPGECESFEIEIDREELERTGVQSVQTVRMRLEVSRNYTEPLFEQAVQFDLSADLTAIAPEPAQSAMEVTALWDGLEFTLLDLSVEDDAHITGEMRIRNTTDEAAGVDTSFFYLDGLQCWGYLSDHIGEVILPPGAAYFTGLKVQLQGYPNEQYRPESLHHLPQALGKAQLHTLGIGVYHDDWKAPSRIEFTLPQPLALPVDESLQQADRWPEIYDRDGVTIRLADCTWQPDDPYQAAYRYINLLMDNRTAHEVQLSIPWDEKESSPCMLVNGQRPLYAHAPAAPAGATAMDSIWYTAGEGGEGLESIDMCLRITGGDGRQDEIRLRLDALGEAREEDGWRVLEADRLRVSAGPEE